MCPRTPTARWPTGWRCRPREQRIQGRKAAVTSAAQVLLAIVASMCVSYPPGPGGLQTIARRTHGWAEKLANGLTTAGYRVQNSRFFDTITVRAPGQARAIVARANAATT